MWGTLKDTGERKRVLTSVVVETASNSRPCRPSRVFRDVGPLLRRAATRRIEAPQVTASIARSHQKFPGVGRLSLVLVTAPASSPGTSRLTPAARTQVRDVLVEGRAARWRAVMNDGRRRCARHAERELRDDRTRPPASHRAVMRFRPCYRLVSKMRRSLILDAM